MKPIDFFMSEDFTSLARFEQNNATIDIKNLIGRGFSEEHAFTITVDKIKTEQGKRTSFNSGIVCSLSDGECNDRDGEPCKHFGDTCGLKQFGQGEPCKRGETAARSGCKPASGEGGTKEGEKTHPSGEKDGMKALSDGQLKREARNYDLVVNEGTREGYNPYREEISIRKKKRDPKDAVAKERRNFLTEWTNEVTSVRRKAWNDTIESTPGNNNKKWMAALTMARSEGWSPHGLTRAIGLHKGKG